ncbi:MULTISPECIES: hypothetical protein [Klebsiella pneumoniae complex]|uniref:hypothetical protein n=1 Tax=Klebsiella pneumoniae complex TaxID=3390273 RepID=UPI0015E8413B|nr:MULTISPECIES: hypothetical protein [Klebsiella]EKU0405950.1 hypothetical protein [Klebsiella aerogenes]HBQ5776342.1 hypothetical protein [Klebsiella pneumoniae subsp. pneumoniae]MCI8258174.1 hypothetical protein [Klebsiella pneumoniae]HBQ5811144.1 hypothetical protein [Klebsiella pneumoniae subsp. pneumoniae]HBQ6021670.1 hypothetical protein [Klebsiella pneumoniae subsp. pneumoniae]
MAEYKVDIYKDSEFKEVLTSIHIEKQYFESVTSFLSEVVNQLEMKRVIIHREYDDSHSLILVDAIGFQTEIPIKSETYKKIPDSEEKMAIVTNITRFSLGIPVSFRK